jgi:tetratricopeptide (TPR) repeat protein
MRRALLLLSSISFIWCCTQLIVSAQGGSTWHHLRLDSGFLKKSSASAPVVASKSSSTEKDAKAAPVQISADPLAQAQASLKANKVDEAITILNAAIKSNPSDYHLFALRAQCYQEIRQTYQALQDVTHAISMTTPNMVLRRQRAGVYSMLHDYPHCLEDLDVITKSGALSASDYFLRANCYSSTGQPKLVIDCTTAGLKLAPTNADAYYMRAKAYSLLNQRKLGDADFDQAVALEKKH